MGEAHRAARGAEVEALRRGARRRQPAHRHPHHQRPRAAGRALEAPAQLEARLARLDLLTQPGALAHQQAARVGGRRAQRQRAAARQLGGPELQRREAALGDRREGQAPRGGVRLPGGVQHLGAARGRLEGEVHLPGDGGGVEGEHRARRGRCCRDQRRQHQRGRDHPASVPRRPRRARVDLGVNSVDSRPRRSKSPGPCASTSSRTPSSARTKT